MKAVKVILWIVAANVALVPAILTVNWLLANDDTAMKTAVSANEISAAVPLANSVPSDRSESPEPIAAIDDAASVPRTPPRFDKVAYQMDIAALTDALNAAAGGSVKPSPDSYVVSGSASTGCTANFSSVEGPRSQKRRVSADFADITEARVVGIRSDIAYVSIGFAPAPTGGNRVEYEEDGGAWRTHPGNLIDLWFSSIDKARKVEAMIVDLRDRCRRLKLHEGEGG